MSSLLERLTEAQNSRDAERLASHFAHDYRSDQPTHPSRNFSGRAQVRGVIIATIHDDQIAAARLYVDTVEPSGEGIDAAVEQLYRPPHETT